jgi:L-alanine-DL-glutamate epimerase-like enolase superfamily enzyme
MNGTTRRNFLQAAGTVGCKAGVAAITSGFGIVSGSTRKSDIRIEDLSLSYQEYIYRAPVKFAGSLMNRASVLTVKCTVRTAEGKIAHGFGTMPFNHIFSYPSVRMSQDVKNSAMKELAQQLAKVTSSYKDFGHPIEIYWALAPLYLRAAAEVSERLNLPDPIPKLCTLVTSSAFDAAVHDSFGKVHNINCFHTYGPEFMNYDLSRYLGAEYKGEYPSQYLQAEPKARMPLVHLISAVDPIEESENTKPIHDGLPETLPEWIHYNGLVEFKIKVNGDDLKWDVERVLHVDKVTTQTQEKLGVKTWAYSLDFNEKCPNIDYFITFLRQIKEKMPIGYARIRYVEQPTSRNLKEHPENRMQEAAKLCPVVIDESLTDVESLLLARQMGWTGAALKSAKGLTNMIMIASVAAKRKIYLCGGDMSCPGAALIQTASLHAHVPDVTSVEANARQYLPAANKGWETRFPGMFHITDGLVRTAELNRPGLSAPEDH